MDSKIYLLRNFVRRAPKRERLPTSRFTCCFERERSAAPALKPVVSAGTKIVKTQDDCTEDSSFNLNKKTRI